MIATLAAIASAATAVAAFGGMSAIAVTNGLSSQVIPSANAPLPPIVVPEPIDPPTPPGAEPAPPSSTVPDPVPTPARESDPADGTFTMTQSTGSRTPESGGRWVARAPDDEDDDPSCDEEGAPDRDGSDDGRDGRRDEPDHRHSR